jgi:hypothetical protein
MKWPDQGGEVKLKFLLLNAENLFVLVDQRPTADVMKLEEIQWQKLSSSVYENKPLKKLKELKKLIEDQKPDLIMLCEVGGIESLNNFNEHFLGQQYSAALIEGNSDRNIDVGFLVSKKCQFYFDLQSNKNRSIQFQYDSKGPQLKFARDVAELRLFTQDMNNPFLVILLTHLKSHLDPEKVDPQGNGRRTAELKTLVDIALEIKAQHPKTPLMIAGDLNGNASRHNTDPEFVDLYQRTDFEDVLELSGIKPENRWTFYQVKAGGGRQDGKQLDYVFLDPQLQSQFIKDTCRVLKYKDEFGFDLDWPMTLEAKLDLPSDHYPLVFELEKLKVW